MQINSGFHGCIGFLRIDKVDYDLSYPGRHVKKQENINPCEDVNGEVILKFLSFPVTYIQRNQLY